MTAHGDNTAAVSIERSLEDQLAEGLAIARRSDALTFIAMSVSRVSVEAVAAAWPSSPLVVWASGATGIVGVGIAREIRGTGAARFAEVIACANRIRIGAVVGKSPWSPRILGGFAFAPGAADREPWTGFGDAWFALPRWTYSVDGWLVLAVDAQDAERGARWRDELDIFRRCLTGTYQVQPPPAVTEIDADGADEWRRNVSGIVAAVTRGEYAKVVAARHARVTLARQIQAADLLAELSAQQSDCTRLLVRPDGGASLVAATPERLVHVAQHRVECDALAGS